MNSDRDIDFELDGYELVCVNRKNKNAGGVALFVDRKFYFKVDEKLSVAVDQFFEYVTIEILLEKRKITL